MKISYEEIQRKIEQTIQSQGLDLRVFHQEMHMKSHIAEVHMDISKSSDTVCLHSHSFYEIIFCSGGSVPYLLNHNRYRVLKGDVLLIPPGIIHGPLLHEETSEPYQRISLWLNAECFDNYALKTPALHYSFSQCEKGGSYLLRSPSSTWTGIQAGFQHLLQESLQKHLGWDFCVAVSALDLMMHLSRTYYYQTISLPTALQSTPIDSLMHYIDTNLSSKLSLEKIASDFAVSKSTISHLFKKETGTSFYQFVIQRRMIFAKNRILQGSPLCQVWIECGFSDYSSFYRLFKKEYGVSPAHFQVLRRQKEE